MASDVTSKAQEQMPSYFMESLSKLNLNDRFLFDETMEDKESYQAVVSMDVQKKIYYTEMQKNNTGNLKKRSRYYQAQMDVSLLELGSVNFNLLNDSCFVMIAPFDIFGKNLYRYTFEGTCRECPELSLGDGAVRVFINPKGRNGEEFSQEFLDFMDYINASTDEVADRTDSEKIKKIHERVKRIKISEKMGVKYMQKWEEIAYAREEGKEEGRSEEIVKSVESVMKNFNLNLQRACEGLGNTIEGYYKAKESISKRI